MRSKGKAVILMPLDEDYSYQMSETLFAERPLRWVSYVKQAILPVNKQHGGEFTEAHGIIM